MMGACRCGAMTSTDSLSSAVSPSAPAPVPASPSSRSPTPFSGLASSAQREHPLLLAAVLVWLSIELIGDGLLALLTLTGVKTASVGRQVTPS